MFGSAGCSLSASGIRLCKNNRDYITYVPVVFRIRIGSGFRRAKNIKKFHILRGLTASLLITNFI
jgi:hypothetical protein